MKVLKYFVLFGSLQPALLDIPQRQSDPGTEEVHKICYLFTSI